MKCYFIGVIILTFLFSSCSSNSSVRPAEVEVYIDTVDKEISEHIGSNPRLMAYHLKLSEKLKLQSLSSGFVGLQLRIWIDCDSEISQKLIVLKKDKPGWDGTFYLYRKELDETGNLVGVRDISIKQRTPKSGWKIFSDNLISTGILELPDYLKLDNYSFPADGSHGVGVEIGTPNSYRFYIYPELGPNAKTNNEAAKLLEALRLIEREFNYDWYCK